MEVEYPGIPLAPKAALPCPFCGEQPYIMPWHGGGPRKRMVQCGNESCDIAPSVTGADKRKALAKWNRRSQTQAIEKACEWSEIESDSGIYNTCKDEFHIEDGLELWEHCHHCGGKIVVVDDSDSSARAEDK